MPRHGSMDIKTELWVFPQFCFKSHTAVRSITSSAQPIVQRHFIWDDIDVPYYGHDAKSYYSPLLWEWFSKKILFTNITSFDSFKACNVYVYKTKLLNKIIETTFIAVALIWHYFTFNAIFVTNEVIIGMICPREQFKMRSNY